MRHRMCFCYLLVEMHGYRKEPEETSSPHHHHHHHPRHPHLIPHHTSPTAGNLKRTSARLDSPPESGASVAAKQQCVSLMRKLLS